MKIIDNHFEYNFRHRRGQSLLEFAITLPVMLLIIFGVLDLGRVFYSTIALRGAVREGARYFISHPGVDDPTSDTDQVDKTRDIVQESAANYGMNLADSDIDIICDPTTCDVDDAANKNASVTVTASTQFDLIIGFVLPTPINLQQSTEMQILVPPG